MKKVLLHICCAPCAIYPFETLTKQGFIVEGFFYNPNIHPLAEYLRRKEAVENFNNIFGVKTYFGEYEQDLYLERRQGIVAKDLRCKSCFRLRIEKTQQFAAENNFNFFTTTLLVSPYQSQELIKEIGFEVSLGSKTQFLFSDFRSGFRYGHARAKEFNFYHQKYCGCLLSQEEREQEKSIKAKQPQTC